MHLQVLLDKRKLSSNFLKYLAPLRKLKFDIYSYFTMRVNKHFPSEPGVEINKCLSPR